MRFKKGAELIVFLLGNGIKLVVVAARAAKGEAKQPLARALNGLKQPRVAVKLVPVAPKETGGTQGIQISGRNLISSQHLGEHTVISLVGID